MRLFSPNVDGASGKCFEDIRRYLTMANENNVINEALYVNKEELQACSEKIIKCKDNDNENTVENENLSYVLKNNMSDNWADKS